MWNRKPVARLLGVAAAAGLMQNYDRADQPHGSTLTFMARPQIRPGVEDD
jgi:hypothetical protein